LGNKVAREIVPMLEAVTQAGGTATRAQVPGFRVGGKTGTVHKLDARGYSPNRYSAVFAGIAPVSEPRYAMAVMIDEPSNGQYYGGEAAAPVFSHLMQGVLQLMGAVPDALPTQEAKPQTVDKAKTEKMTVKGAAA
jgi:cell division protein FtsI (penicillin-binding protein 3)